MSQTLRATRGRGILGSPIVRRLGLLAALLVVGGAVFASLDLQPTLRRLDVAVLSGTEGGHYHRLVAQLSAAAAREHGRVVNLATQGSIDNITRLAAARVTCDAQFALVQDGLDWPEGIEFLGRLPRAESVFILGRTVDQVRTLADLRGLRVGVGPAGSGTNYTARTIFESDFLAGLQFTLSNHSLDEQLALVESGALDLVVMVMDEDAPLITQAIRDRKLSILSLPQADVIARRFPRVRAGRIGAGQFDAIALLPPVDKTVLRVETLLVGNGCARATATTALLTLLSREYPDFLRRNEDAPNTSGLPIATAARAFFADRGPDLASQHVPWAVDIMPLRNWIYAITAVSLLFNAMSVWSRFRLWRLDARRAEIEEQITEIFEANLTPREIAELAPTPRHLTTAHRAQVEALETAVDDLRTLCRKQAAGWIADMGEELPYRYQEQLTGELLRGLRRFRGRVRDAGGP